MSSTAYFSVTTPRPITNFADDVAADLAKNVGHATVGEVPTGAVVTDAVVAALAAEALNLLSDATYTIVVDATGGHFTITTASVATGSILATASAATVQAAMEATSTIAAGDVLVTGGPGDSGGTTPYYVQFVGPNLGGQAVTLTVADVDLSGGGTTVARTSLITGGVDPTA